MCHLVIFINFCKLHIFRNVAMHFENRIAYIVRMFAIQNLMAFYRKFCILNVLPTFYICITHLKTVENQYCANGIKILWKSMATVNCLVTNILQNIFFCVPLKKNNSDLEQRLSK